MVNYQGLFSSFFQGGFECSTHRLKKGKRLDEIEFSRHDRFVRQDYLRMRRQGIRTVRDGIRWHLIEQRAGVYDFSSVVDMVRAARETKTQVIWDLCHYGWPDWLDIFEPRFIDAFAKLAKQFAKLLASETDQQPFIVPINEISFFSWAAGQTGYLNPFAVSRGHELKHQLVRASIAGIEALWDVNPDIRIVQAEPLINVLPKDPKNSRQRKAAEDYRMSQFEAWDMLAGRLHPELGGAEKYLDIIGGNYYAYNQWILNGPTVRLGTPRYRPFREILKEVNGRYGRPFFVAETGIEDDARPVWFSYVCGEVREAIRAGAQIEGICLYPIVNHPGWDDDRHCFNGLWDYADDKGRRKIYRPLADELRRQRGVFKRLLKKG